MVFKEDDAEQFSLLTKLRASYQVPSGFNVATGEPLSSMQPLNFIKKDIDKDNAGRVLFTNYVFTPSTGKQEMETISFQDVYKRQGYFDTMSISLGLNINF